MGLGVGGEVDGAIVVVLEGWGSDRGGFLDAIAGDDDVVAVADAEPAAIEGPVMIFAEGEAVAEAIVAEFGEGFDVGSIDDGLAGVADDFEAAEGALLLVGVGDASAEGSAAEDLLFFAFLFEFFEAVDGVAGFEGAEFVGEGVGAVERFDVVEVGLEVGLEEGLDEDEAVGWLLQ